MHDGIKIKSSDKTIYTITKGLVYGDWQYNLSWEGSNGLIRNTGFGYTESQIKQYLEDGTWTVVEDTTHIKIEVLTAEFNYQGLYKGAVIDNAKVLPDGSCVKFRHNGKNWVLNKGDYLVFKDETAFTEKEEEYTGASSSYYRVHIATPVTAEEPYDAECLDIIEALGMTWGEANVFKATWRKAAARKGLKKKGNTAVYDAEKMVFFSQREEVLERAKEEK